MLVSAESVSLRQECTVCVTLCVVVIDVTRCKVLYVELNFRAGGVCKVSKFVKSCGKVD